MHSGGTLSFTACASQSREQVWLLLQSCPLLLHASHRQLSHTGKVTMKTPQLAYSLPSAASVNPSAIQ